MFLSGPGSRAVVQAQPSSQSTDFGLHAQRGPCCVLPALFGAQDLWSCLTRIWKMNTERGEQRSEQVGQPPPAPRKLPAAEKQVHLVLRTALSSAQCEPVRPVCSGTSVFSSRALRSRAEGPPTHS